MLVQVCLTLTAASVTIVTDVRVSAQLGLLDSGKLPVAGVEVARKVIDPFGQPSNTMLARWKESEGLAIN